MDAEHGLARPAIPSSFEALLEAEPQVLESKRVFQGEVLSRRVKSKHLTFCTLQVQSDEQDEHVALCFAAALVDESQVPSPTRRNDLPVGLQIEVEVVRAPRFRPEFLVRRWRRAPDGGSPVVETGAHGVSMARCLALKDQVNRRAKALLGGDGLALCKRWSGCAAGSCSEACEFRHYFQSAEEETKARHARCARERSQRLQAQEQEEYGEGPHEKVDKARRAARFAAWLVKTYGREGDLSWQLSVEYGIPCTLIDPMVRRGGELKSWQRRALRKRGREQAFEHLPVTFEEPSFSSIHGELLNGASVVVGLHPDEATEAIVDVALTRRRAGVPLRFAVVPCCVFAERFPRDLAGVPVRSLNQFCAYLRSKDPHIQEDMLDFEGRNKVLYI
ncbi:unnamed protein product [Durusdinium trenchii]|uniref:Uncharacterized protein n=1 Tax=Durusdinium trenchii TaxID=1381693 RepID=A0ABP0NID6_9DINO